MPQVAQQDYIYIPVESLDTGDEQSLSNEVVRALYRAARNNTMMDVVLVYESAKTRILGCYFEPENDLLHIYFYSNSEGGVIGWQFSSEPEPEPEETE